jgi:hypothetical protein
VHHLIELNRLSQKLTSKEDAEILDVYRHSDTSEVLHSIEEINKLKAKILLHKEEFPENSILDDLLQCIDLFLGTSCDRPQMHFASLLEKLLGELYLGIGRLINLLFQRKLKCGNVTCQKV